MTLKSVAREPLLHFLGVGAALFLYFHLHGSGSTPASTRIVVTAGQIDHLAAGFKTTWLRPPTESELTDLIDDWVREEIAVREGTATGLDRDDAIVRGRLRQKFEFQLEDVADAAPPTEAELRAWLTTHADMYRGEPQVAFRQVFVSRDRHGASTDSEAREILAKLTRAGPTARVDALGDPTKLPGEVELTPLSEVARDFGQVFADQLAKLAPGTWTGPVESSLGLHVVLVRRRVEGTLPELADVHPAVDRAFQADRRKRRIAAAYENLLRKYTVVTERPSGS